MSKLSFSAWVCQVYHPDLREAKRIFKHMAKTTGGRWRVVQWLGYEIYKSENKTKFLVDTTAAQ